MDIASVYLQVIRNVVDGVRADFSSEQLDETSLRTLAALWEHKLLESGSLSKDLDENMRNVEKEPLDLAEKQGVKRKAENFDANNSSKDVAGKAKEASTADVGCKSPLETPVEKTVAGTSAAIVTTKSSAQFDATVDYGETLSSDSDQESQGLQGVDVQTTNLVLAQFDKVTRAKNKWKCSLKGGVMTLNGKDVLFGKANGEFFWN